MTGGAGFVGSHLVDALLGDGFQVAVIDDLSSGEETRVAAEAEMCVLDIVDRPALEAVVRRVKPQAIYHLAAQASVVASVEDPGRDCDVNVRGTLNVLESARLVAAPVVFTSTGGALYGDAAPMPTSEDRIPAPLSPYGASKWAAEAYVNTWSLSGEQSHTVCRLGNVYGPRQNPHGEAGVVAIFSYHLFAGRPPKIYGHGRPTRDYIYVADVISALLAASGRSGTYNIATGTETDVATIWRVLQQVAERSAHGAAASGERIEPELADLRPGELQHSCLDVSLAARELGWSPAVKMDEGLRLTYEALAEEFQAA